MVSAFRQEVNNQRSLNFFCTPTDHEGLTKDALEFIVIKDNKFKLIKLAK